MTLRSIHLGAAIGLLGATLIIASSSTPVDKSIYSTKSVGEVLPMVKITNEREQSNITDADTPPLTLLHFWAAYDAGSRAQQISYHRAIDGTLAKRIIFQSVSLDTDPEVYKCTLALDGIEARSNYKLIDVGQREQIIELFGLKKGFHSFLLNTSGEILAIDPDPTLLAQFINH